MIKGICTHCGTSNQLLLEFEPRDRTWQLHCLTCSAIFPVTPDMKLEIPKDYRPFSLPRTSGESPMQCSCIYGTTIPALASITYTKHGL